MRALHLARPSASFAVRLAMVAALLTSVACGSDPESPSTDTASADTGGTDTGAIDTDQQTDTNKPDTSSTDTGSVDTDQGDAGTDEDTSGSQCPGGFGCPCSNNGDCDTSQCIETPEGNVCTQTCIETCPGGYKCVNSGGVDGLSICVPALGNLCNPCNKNSDCTTTGHGDASCVDQGDAGAFCGIGCNNDSQCPSGYGCQEAKDVAGNDVKQCVVKTGVCSCSPAALKKEMSTVCYNTVGASKCAGTRTCLADGKPGAPSGGGLTACIAANPEAEVCDGKDNDCDGDIDESTCDDNEQCTTDECDPKAGCKNTNKPGKCDADGSACTPNDTCTNGKCVAGDALVCNDNNPCTKDVCDAVKGCTYEPGDGPCNADDNPCTTNDACKDGKCEKGPTKSCTSESPCVNGACSIVSGECKYTITDGFSCNDGNLCTTDSKCTGELCSGKPVSCDDLNSCTSDSCDPVKGCQHASLTGPCDDGNPCTGQDACEGATCKGSPIDVKVACSDSNPCTSDSCDPSVGCQNKPIDGDPCEDGNTCTTTDTCVKGTCYAGPNKCKCTSTADCAKSEDGNACNGTLICDKATSLWECKIDPATIVTCNTANDGACKLTSCEPSTGACKTNNKTDGLTCDADGSICTKDDACKDGVCTAGATVDCDDKNPCTDDACDPKAGCKSTPNTAPCNADDDACTESDVCMSGACVAGTAKVCDDKNTCTKDACDAKTGACTTSPLSQGCDDGNGCTVSDTCGQDAKGGWSCLPGAAKDCDDKLACTVDSCDPKSGICENVSALGKEVECYTGDPKTKGVGACKTGKQTCKLDGTLTTCTGEVTPAAKEICGNSADDTCDGVTDDGCAPTGVVGRMVTASVAGKAGNLELRGSAGASLAAGTASAQGAKYTVNSGFYAWLTALLGK